MHNILRRTISTVILFTLSYLILHYSHHTFGSLIFLLAILLINALGLYEFYRLVEKKGQTSFMIIGIITGLCYVVIEFLRNASPFCSMPELPYSFIAFIVLTLIFIMQIINRAPASPLFNSSMTIIGLIYVTWFISFIIRINYYPLSPVETTVSGTGAIFVLFTIFVAKGADTFAYLIGSRFGKHKLAPAISPKKTIEGVFGSLIGGLIIGILIYLLAAFPVRVTLFQICVMALAISAVAQFGDLVESLLKRDAQIKDSGSKFPGVGGILDLIDSLLFALPATYFFMKLWILK